MAVVGPRSPGRRGKSPEAFRTISEVAGTLDVPQHVLRFWESKFTQVKPLKRGGGRRYYRPEDVDLLRGIRHLLYVDGYTIKGVQKLLREHGVKAVIEGGRQLAQQGGNEAVGLAVPPPAPAAGQSAPQGGRGERLGAIVEELSLLRDMLRRRGG